MKDIQDIEDIMQKAKERPIGNELAQLLGEICPRSYNKAMATASHTVIGRPEVYRRSDGTTSVLFKERHPVTRGFIGPRHDIDELDCLVDNPTKSFDGAQLRWDAVCAIKNMLQYNCDEIPEL